MTTQVARCGPLIRGPECALRHLLATGHEGGDASHLYEDAKLMGQIYSAPYALLEPTLVLVVADGDEVAGFAAKCDP